MLADRPQRPGAFSKLKQERERTAALQDDLTMLSGVAGLRVATSRRVKRSIQTQTFAEINYAFSFRFGNGR